jgi:phosphate transport system substrate-binding protein
MKYPPLFTHNAAIALAAVALACGERVDPVRIDGSPGVAPLVTALVTEYRSRHPGAQVDLASGLGSSARLKAVQDGQIQVAMASHGVDSADLEQRALAARTIAKTAVVFAVHAGVPVRELTAAQVCDLYAGRLTNWRQLGGPALAVTPLFRPPAEVDAAVVLEGVDCLAKLTLSDGVIVIDRPDSMAAAIAGTPGAIGVTSAPMVAQHDGRMHALTLNGVAPSPQNVATGAYPLNRAAILVYRKAVPKGVSQLLAFIDSPEGDRVIEANGAVPVARRP